MDYPDDSLWNEQKNYKHHLMPDGQHRTIVCPMPVQDLTDKEKSQISNAVDYVKLLNIKHILEPQIKDFLKKKDYSGLFDLYMQRGLSCFALDLAEKQLPEKLDEVMEKFPDLEGRVAAGAK